MDEKFEVIPVPAKINQTSDQDVTDAPGGISAPVHDDYTEEDLMFISESLASLPSIIFPRVPLRTKEQITPFNHQFYRYCKKKGLNPFEYFFDEFGLVMAGVGLAGGIWKDYKEEYGKNGKEQSHKDQKLSSDFEHSKQVAQQKEKDIQDGKITMGVGQ